MTLAEHLNSHLVQVATKAVVMVMDGVDRHSPWSEAMVVVE